MPSIAQTAAILHRRTSDDQLAFIGTAFAFRRQGAFLTAAHCVRSLEANEVFLTVPRLNGGRPVQAASIDRHESADLAVVKVPSAPTHLVDPFYIIAPSYDAGSAIGSWGFPEDTSSEGGLVPTPRIFRGTIQRLFQHASHLGYSYAAGELSFSAPGGLSGGPVFAGIDDIHLIGVVTENFESTKYLYSTLDFLEDGREARETMHQVINYGLFVDLRLVTRWLDQLAGRELG